MTPAEGAALIPDDVLIQLKVYAVNRCQAVRQRSERQVTATQTLDMLIRGAFRTATTDRAELDILMNAAVREHQARGLPSRLSLRGIRR